MSTPINPQKAGLALGGTLAAWHIVWSLCVVTGLAQPLLNWVFELHMLKPVYVVMPFVLIRSVLLVVVTFVLGFLFGGAFAAIWNKIQGR